VERGFTAGDRFWQYVLFRVRPALLASWVKRLVGVHRRDIDTPGGAFYADPVSQFAVALGSDRGYEPEMSHALGHFLKPAATFVDIGANEGFFSVMASRLVGATGRVVAVEPQSRLKGVVERNFRLNGVTNATLHSCAISDREGTADLFVSPDTNTGSTALRNMTRYRLPSEVVPVTTLTKLFDSEGIRSADLVKMDIEGAEYEAVLGSPGLFEAHRIKAFAFELHHAAIASRGGDPEAVIRFLQGCGYALAPGLPASVWVSPDQGAQ
jgi:FkbM family methyltransferase